MLFDPASVKQISQAAAAAIKEQLGAEPVEVVGSKRKPHAATDSAEEEAAKRTKTADEQV